MTRVTAPETVIAGAWIGWWMSWMAAAAWRNRAVAQPPRSLQVRYRLLAIAGYMLLIGAFRQEYRERWVLWRTPAPVAWILVVAAVAGFALTWWARLHLGRLWSVNVGRTAHHRVVDTGPYGIVRHPIYSGIIIASVATAILLGNAAGWLGAAVLTLGWLVKARLEERFLREQLGTDYAAYLHRVPMIVPFLR
jgi:protein-S-isoprenylcysteine O-methyltransferase Ste14